MAALHVAAALGGSVTLATALPDPRDLWAAVDGATPPISALGDLVLLTCSVTVWAILAWSALVTIVAIATRLPGSLGRSGRAMLGRLAPSAVRRVLLVAVSVSVVTGASACAAPSGGDAAAGNPAPASTAPTAPAASTGAPDEIVLDLDWLATGDAGSAVAPTPSTPATSSPGPSTTSPSAATTSQPEPDSPPATDSTAPSPTPPSAATSPERSHPATPAPPESEPSHSATPSPEPEAARSTAPAPPEPSPSTIPELPGRSNATAPEPPHPAHPLPAATRAPNAGHPDASGGGPGPHNPPAAAEKPGRQPATSYTVQPGDSLWSIAASHLADSASPTRIDREWRSWYATNRDVIGNDPNLILPGQQLTPPTNGGTP